MRLRAKRDASEAAIVDALRRCGWTVTHLSLKDAPDLLLARAGMMVLAEVKTGTGELRPGQARWHAAWPGPPVQILRTVEDVIELSMHYR